MTAYYNEFDPKAAAWLRELIAAGLIPPGDVDERSITDISPHELTGYTQQHFFAGIGGWAYALRLAGWADDRPVRTGSCPCQPFSAAGKQLAEADERHLWPAFYNLITFGEPTEAFGEQVASALGRLWLAGVRADLEGVGYEVGAADLCAAGVGAPHIRQRIFWGAYPSRRMANAKGQRWPRGKDYQDGGRRELSSRRGSEASRLANPDGRQPRNRGLQPSGQHGQQPEDGGTRGMEHAARDGRQQRRAESGGRCAPGGCGAGFWSAFDLLPCTDGKARRVEPGTFPLAHGVPGRVGLLRGYGNAIVPQVAAEFIQACEEAIG